MAAERLGFQIFDRAEFLGAFTRTYKNVINISGTHGKTTTTSMISMIMIDEGLDPTVHLGAELEAFGGTVRVGRKPESADFRGLRVQQIFSEFSSTTAVITNIDHDHVDCYPTIQDVIDVLPVLCSFALTLAILLSPAATGIRQNLSGSQDRI